MADESFRPLIVFFFPFFFYGEIDGITRMVAGGYAPSGVYIYIMSL